MEKNIDKRREIDKLNLDEGEWNRVNIMLDILAVCPYDHFGIMLICIQACR